MRPALRHWAPLILAVAGAAVYLLIRPASADLAAHLYRAGLFRREGFAVWDGAWYGGHHLPGYSVLFPPFEAYLRPRVAGAIAAVAATALFAALARDHWGERGALAAAWFGAGSVTLLLTGRLAFAAGVAAALLALLLWERRGLGAGVAGALLTGLTSPVAALFLALAGVATRRRAGVVLAVAALGPALVVTVLFPEGGTEPFSFGSLWPVLVLSAGAVAPSRARSARCAPRPASTACSASACSSCRARSARTSSASRRSSPGRSPRARSWAGGRACSRRSCCRCSSGSGPTPSATCAWPRTTPRRGPRYYTGVVCFLERAERLGRPGACGDPVHPAALGGGARGPARAARPRLGAPARPEVRRGLRPRR